MNGCMDEYMDRSREGRWRLAVRCEGVQRWGWGTMRTCEYNRSAECTVSVSNERTTGNVLTQM